MSLDDSFRRLFGDAEPTHFGSGWLSGVLSVFLGVLGFGAVLCLHFPALLTSPQLRELYPMDMVRALIQLVIGLAFLLGLVSALLRRRKVLGLVGMCLAMTASLFGGARVPVSGPVRGAGAYLGLDWFLANILLLAVVFVPMERLFPRDPAQLVFRKGWTTDGVHFLVSHLLVQLSTWLTISPARALFSWAAFPEIQAALARQPLLIQFVEIVLVSDLAEYGVHRLFHRVPVLWRFHAIHHSSTVLDWLAGSRLHLVDIVVTRGATFVPLFVLGFSSTAVYAYLVFVSFHAVFIHANVGWKLGWLEALLVTPRIHHWHHAADAEAVDRNFAVHLPAIDRFFGTFHAPQEAWPRAYGVVGETVPEGYLAQLVAPFRRRSGP